MIVLAGGDLVLPDRILSNASSCLDGSRVASLETRTRAEPSGAAVIDVRQCYVVPGFVDVHVHGVEGVDTLDEGAPVAQIAAALPRYGVTSFCPTTVACPPAQLRDVLEQVRSARAARARPAAPACSRRISRAISSTRSTGVRSPPTACVQPARYGACPRSGGHSRQSDILAAIAAARPEVGIVTLAPELPGGLDLDPGAGGAGPPRVAGPLGRRLRRGDCGIEAGARHATHLFNRMTPIAHRAAGARRRRALARGDRGGTDLRRVPRASRHVPRGDCRQGDARHHGDHGRHRRVGSARRDRSPGWAAAASASATRPSCSTTGRWPAAR